MSRERDYILAVAKLNWITDVTYNNSQETTPISHAHEPRRQIWRGIIFKAMQIKPKLYMSKGWTFGRSCQKCFFASIRSQDWRKKYQPPSCFHVLIFCKLKNKLTAKRVCSCQNVCCVSWINPLWFESVSSLLCSETVKNQRCCLMTLDPSLLVMLSTNMKSGAQ